MRTIKNYSGWMAEEIAKTYLLETNLFDIYESNEQKFDFLCMSKNDFNKIIAVEVKASKYSQSRIIREYRKIRNEYTSLNIPIIMFYVNYENKTGLIEIINKQLTDKLITLSTENLIKELKNINYA